MSAIIIQSELLFDLSLEEQQLLCGGEKQSSDDDSSWECPKYQKQKHHDCYYTYYSKDRPDDWKGNHG